MIDFFQALASHGFLQHALIAAFLSSIAAGLTGTLVVIKRLSYLAGGLAHASLGGIGIAYYYGWNPFWGGTIFSLGAALIIGWIRLRYRQSEDTLISAFWAVGMAIGVICLYKTPGYYADLEYYLFGNILMITENVLWVLVALDGLLLMSFIFFYRPILSVTFDEEFAKACGLSVVFYYLLLFTLMALTVIILVSCVGLILVIALLTLPASAMSVSFSNPLKIMIFSCLSSALLICLGLMFSYIGDMPSGPVIILLTGAFYIAMHLGRQSRMFLKRKRTLKLPI